MQDDILVKDFDTEIVTISLKLDSNYLRVRYCGLKVSRKLFGLTILIVVKRQEVVMACVLSTALQIYLF